MIKTTVDITPTWSTAMDILILMLESGDDEGKALAKQELRDLAVKLDKMNQADAWSTIKEIRDDN
tara:strand:- start:536 stop:730 length:195 start_codon:yes stop_codon:yes gene_type:complete